MIPKASHGLGLSGDTGSGDVVETFCLDNGQGYVPVQDAVMGQIDFLLTAFPQETFNLVTDIGE